MILYFAGTESRHYAQALKAAGGTRALESAYYLGYEREPNELGFPDYLLDSGGFTLRKNAKSLPAARYAEYLNRYQVPRAFNLDTLDFDESRENQRVLERETKASIIPVFHYSDWVSSKWRGELRAMAADYPYISVAGLGSPNLELRAAFYEFVFAVVGSRVKVHGLGATAIDHMLQFPFFSVDSTTWINAQKFGQWICFERGRIVKHQSPRVMVQRAAPKLTNVNAGNFEWQRFITQAVVAFSEFTEYVTRLWAQRGVSWAS